MQNLIYSKGFVGNRGGTGRHRP